MHDNLNQIVLEFKGWTFVASCVGSYVVWRWSIVRNERHARFEAAWQQQFEPNRVNVAEREAYVVEPHVVDHEYRRLMDNQLPDDWRDWGDKAGLRPR